MTSVCSPLVPVKGLRGGNIDSGQSSRQTRCGVAANRPNHPSPPSLSARPQGPSQQKNFAFSPKWRPAIRPRDPFASVYWRGHSTSARQLLRSRTASLTIPGEMPISRRPIARGGICRCRLCSSGRGLTARFPVRPSPDRAPLTSGASPQISPTGWTVASPLQSDARYYSFRRARGTVRGRGPAIFAPEFYIAQLADFFNGSLWCKKCQPDAK